ncbi:MAG: hypothetical protein K6F35_03430, partial [Lachnospiraceae bacterium]|nr:hypothetical protein [Lachnospiraceae bacterium]
MILMHFSMEINSPDLAARQVDGSFVCFGKDTPPAGLAFPRRLTAHLMRSFPLASTMQSRLGEPT